MGDVCDDVRDEEGGEDVESEVGVSLTKPAGEERRKNKGAHLR